MRVLKITIAIVSLLIVLLAIAFYATFKPNTRYFQKANIVLMGRLEKGKAKYHMLEIGNRDRPYDGSLGLILRCDDDVIAVDSVSVQEIVSLADRVGDPNEPYNGNWPDNAQKLWFCTESRRVGWLYIVVTGDKVQRIEVNARSMTPRVSIRSSRTNDWISFPVSESDAEALFGDPDRVFNQFVH